jgi:transcriptional regulator with XRE-family HTH domain
VEVVDNRTEVREFLISRRARLAPDQVGLPALGGSRRVAGLRREEVALLAGVSVEYYTRLERGSLRGVSQTVLEALSRALQLDDAERAHLFDLARAANATAGAVTMRRVASPGRIRPGVQRVLDAITAPAWIRNGRSDILATNLVGRALYSPVFDSRLRPANTARFLFLDPRSADFYLDW